MDRASLSPPLRAADRVVVLGDVPPECIPWFENAERFPHDTPEARERLDVASLVQWAERHRPAGGRLVVMTDGDLHIPECESLLGFSDDRAQVGIVSTARIATKDAAQTRRRIANSIAHELGHLDGLRHCAHACVMRPVTDALALDDRPDTPCGRCPRRRSRLFVIVASLAILLAVVGIGGRLLDRQAAPRPAAIPPAVAALLDEFPIDTGSVASRPVTLVMQRLDARTVDVPLDVPVSTFPPGVEPAALSQASAAMASALYRTPESEPIVHVHVFEGRGDLPALLSALGCGSSAALASADGGCRLQIESGDAVVRPRPPNRAVLVFAPKPDGRDMAARLASSVAVGGGIRNDVDMSRMLGALPTHLPDGFALDSLSVTNVHRVPEAIDETTRRFFRDEGPAAAVQLRRVMPMTLITADYRGKADTRVGAVIGYYGTTPSAWMSRFTLGRVLAPWDEGTIDLASGTAWRLNAGSRQYAWLQRGRFVAAVYAEQPQRSELLLRALADALQL